MVEHLVKYLGDRIRALQEENQQLRAKIAELERVDLSFKKVINHE